MQIHNTFFTKLPKFGIKDLSVLGVTYFDIFWPVKDLSQDEIDAYNNRKRINITDLIEKLYKKTLEAKIICPNCRISSMARCFYGDCIKCVCPICLKAFVPIIEYLHNHLCD